VAAGRGQQGGKASTQQVGAHAAPTSRQVCRRCYPFPARSSRGVHGCFCHPGRCATRPPGCVHEIAACSNKFVMSSRDQRTTLSCHMLCSLAMLPSLTSSLGPWMRGGRSAWGRCWQRQGASPVLLQLSLQAPRVEHPAHQDQLLHGPQPSPRQQLLHLLLHEPSQGWGPARWQRQSAVAQVQVLLGLQLPRRSPRTQVVAGLLQSQAGSTCPGACTL
jgi:hypothetical protein